MPKVKSMVLSAVFLLSPPPPSLPPLSPVEISHFLQAQCWFHTGAQGLVCEMGKGRHGEVKCGGIWVQAKNNLHLHFSQFLSAKFYKINVRVEELLFFELTLQSHTSQHLGEATVQLQSYISHASLGQLVVSCSRAPRFGRASLFTLPFGVFEVTIRFKVNCFDQHWRVRKDTHYRRGTYPIFLGDATLWKMQARCIALWLCTSRVWK